MIPRFYAHIRSGSGALGPHAQSGGWRLSFSLCIPEPQERTHGRLNHQQSLKSIGWASSERGKAMGSLRCVPHFGPIQDIPYPCSAPAQGQQSSWNALVQGLIPASQQRESEEDLLQGSSSGAHWTGRENPQPCRHHSPAFTGGIEQSRTKPQVKIRESQNSLGWRGP